MSSTQNENLENNGSDTQRPKPGKKRGCPRGRSKRKLDLGDHVFVKTGKNAYHGAHIVKDVEPMIDANTGQHKVMIQWQSNKQRTFVPNTSIEYTSAGNTCVAEAAKKRCVTTITNMNENQSDSKNEDNVPSSCRKFLRRKSIVSYIEAIRKIAAGEDIAPIDRPSAIAAGIRTPLRDISCNTKYTNAIEQKQLPTRRRLSLDDQTPSENTKTVSVNDDVPSKSKKSFQSNFGMFDEKTIPKISINPNTVTNLDVSKIVSQVPMTTRNGAPVYDFGNIMSTPPKLPTRRRLSLDDENVINDAVSWDAISMVDDLSFDIDPDVEEYSCSEFDLNISNAPMHKVDGREAWQMLWSNYHSFYNL